MPGLHSYLKAALQRGCLGQNLATRLVLRAVGVTALCVLSGSSALASGSYAAAALSDNPVAFWQLTETGDPSTGSLSANDSSGNGHHGLYGMTSQNAFDGVLSPQPPSFPGFTNGQGALQCAPGDVNSPVSVPYLNLNTNTVTITMWINPSANESAFTGLFMNRYAAGNDAAGLEFGGALNSSGMPGLAYSWNTNSAATWAFNSGLYPRAGTWNFVALVIQSNSATLYLCYTNAGKIYLGLAVNAIPHTPEAFASGLILIGDDVNGSAGDPNLVFNGEISDVAVYKSSLSSDQIVSLFAAGFGVSGFAPFITSQPQSRYVIAGSKVRFNAAGVSGTSPISYQWKLNGTNVNLLEDSTNFTGANSNLLTVLAATTNDVGSYQLLMTNVIGVTASSNATLTVQAPAVVGEWLDGSSAGTNLLDVSGYELATNHGAFLVGARNYVFTNDVPPGKTGQSLLLYNADTGLAISNSSTLDANYDDTFDDRINSAMMVSFWAKGWPNSWNPFVSKYGERTPSPSGGWQLRADGAGNHPCWTMRDTGGTLILGTADFGNPEDLAAASLTFGDDGLWHFYLGSFDANTGLRNLYVDGLLVASETNNGVYSLASAERLCIGARDPDGSNFGSFFKGEIYDVRVYNYQHIPVLCAVPLFILYQDITVLSGQTVQFDASILGSALGFAWTSNGVVVPGATTNTLTLTNATASATYICYGTNMCDNYVPVEFFNLTVVSSATNLVGRWLSGSPTLADVSGYQPAGKHDGYDIGNAGGSYYFTNDVPPGRTGSSLYLNNDGIVITNSSILDGGYTNTFDDTIHYAMTVTFWAKGWPSGWNPFLSKNGETTPSSAGWQFRSDMNNHPVWAIRNTGGHNPAPGTPIFGNPEEMAGANAVGNDGYWHFYVGTYSFFTGIRSLYVDGVLSAQETGNGLYSMAPSEHVCIGARDNAPGNSFGNFFTGEIFDVRIYNFALTNNLISPIPIQMPLPVRNSNQLVLMWSIGTLQQATNPLGPWSPTGATSPFTNDTTAAPQMFYRLSYP